MSETSVSTGKFPNELVRFSYVVLTEAKLASPQATEKVFGMAVLVPKKNKNTLKALNAAIEAAIELGPEKVKGWKANKKPLKLPIRDGGEEKPDVEAYSTCMFFNASKKERFGRPGVVDRGLNPIMDLNEVKSGDWGNVSVNFYPFGVGGNFGVAVGLNHVQKVRDGEALGSQTSIADEFDEVEFEDDDIL